jgi:hypothetical protein
MADPIEQRDGTGPRAQPWVRASANQNPAKSTSNVEEAIHPGRQLGTPEDGVGGNTEDSVADVSGVALDLRCETSSRRMAVACHHRDGNAGTGPEAKDQDGPQRLATTSAASRRMYSRVTCGIYGSSRSANCCSVERISSQTRFVSGSLASSEAAINAL